MAKERNCHICGTHCTEECPTCVAAFKDRQLAKEMTPEERAAEFEMWQGVLEIPFRLLHKRIEELVGRPVWTHEMGTEGCKLLKQEIRSGQQLDLAGVVDKIPAEKLLVAIAPE